ncbi:MAG: hypothetical protein WC989_10050 [Micavibrio sp.]
MSINPSAIQERIAGQTVFLARLKGINKTLRDPDFNPLEYDSEDIKGMELPGELADKLSSRAGKDFIEQQIVILTRSRQMVHTALLLVESQMALQEKACPALSGKGAAWDHSALSSMLYNSISYRQKLRDLNFLNAEEAQELAHEFSDVLEHHLTLTQEGVPAGYESATREGLLQKIGELRLNTLDIWLDASDAHMAAISGAMRDGFTMKKAMDEGIIPDSAATHSRIRKNLDYSKAALMEHDVNLRLAGRFNERVAGSGIQAGGEDFRAGKYYTLAPLNKMPHLPLDFITPIMA